MPRRRRKTCPEGQHPGSRGRGLRGDGSGGRGLGEAELAARGRGGRCGEEPRGIVTLYVDRDATFGSLLPILYTVGRAGASAYQFAVEPTGRRAQLGSDVVHISPPKFAAGDSEPADRGSSVVLVVMISRVDVRVGRHLPASPEQSAWLERVAVGEDREGAMQRITELALAAAAELPPEEAFAPTLYFGIERDVLLQRILDVLAAAAGPDCVMDEQLAGRTGGCLFVDRDIHARSPAPAAMRDP